MPEVQIPIELCSHMHPSEVRRSMAAALQPQFVCDRPPSLLIVQPFSVLNYYLQVRDCFSSLNLPSTEQCRGPCKELAVVTLKLWHNSRQIGKSCQPIHRFCPPWPSTCIPFPEQFLFQGQRGKHQHAGFTPVLPS